VKISEDLDFRKQLFMPLVRNLINSGYSASFLIAGVLHAAVLLVGGWALTQKAEFGMEFGESSVEVNLIAATPDSLEQKVESQPFVEPAPSSAEKSEFILPEKIEEKLPEESPKLIEEKPKLIAERKESHLHKGDGSSSEAGPDSTTLQSSGGVVTEAKPNYLRNPPPTYPENARRMGQEGLVLLTAKIDAEGKPNSIILKESSGFRSLDNAALKTVQKWRFSPAKIGSLPIASEVDIPIRFQIKNSR
jgi:periplasmic protein TonB